MSRYAIAAVLAAVFGSSAEAQYYGSTSYFGPSPYLGTTDSRYYPGTVSGYPTSTFSSFGNIRFNSGVVPANIYGPGYLYSGNGVVPANSYDSYYANNYGPFYNNYSALYGPNYFNTGYAAPGYYGSFYPYYGSGFTTFSPGFTVVRPTVHHRRW